MIKRSITHWTAGGGRASAVDLRHYHLLTEFDGNYVQGNEKIEDNIVTSDGDYAAHTLNLNSGSMGLAMCGMRGAKESPFESGPSPITEKQFERHCALLAAKHIEYGIPVTPETCLTHAEVEPRLGVKQRGKWDLTRLPCRPELRGAFAVGDYMRQRVKAYQADITGMPDIDQNRPTLRNGSRGEFVRDLQGQLQDLGYAVGNPDGIYGARTRDAVMAFQADHSLHVDGVSGERTWDALAKAKHRPARAISEAQLRDRGSETIAAADQGEKRAKAATAGVGGLGALDLGRDALETVSGSGSMLGKAQTILMDNWPVILVILIATVAYYKGPQIMQAIRDIRVKDHVTGRNLGR